MATIKRFEDLEVWQLARVICQDVEKIFQTTEISRNFKLRDQMESSSGSIMDNIAEGYGRGGNQEFHNFLSFSKGSTTELKSQFYRCFDKEYISEIEMIDLHEKCDHIDNKIGAFMSYLRKSDLRGVKFKK